MEDNYTVEDGIVLRDHFAAVALDGMFRCDPSNFYMNAPLDRLQMAKRAYLWADAMLDARVEK